MMMDYISKDDEFREEFMKLYGEDLDRIPYYEDKNELSIMEY